MKFEDIPRLTRDGEYRVDMSWDYLEQWIEGQDDPKIDFDPPFQRAHVWTEEQQRAFVEFCLKGGRGSSEIRFNCVGWERGKRGKFVIVDGKQRVEAARKFMRNELAIFGGHKLSDFEDSPHLFDATFSIRINDLKTDKEVLQWYLDINTGGTPHTNDEIERVKKMLEEMK